MAMGRPREFDVDKALDLALQVFWRKGYEGASMADLTETMGITKPSLYSAFGNKEEFFFARRWIDMSTDPAVTCRLRWECRPRALSLNTCFMKPPTPSPIPTIHQDVLRCRARCAAAMPPNPSNRN